MYRINHFFNMIQTTNIPTGICCKILLHVMGLSWKDPRDFGSKFYVERFIIAQYTE